MTGAGVTAAAERAKTNALIRILRNTYHMVRSAYYMNSATTDPAALLLRAMLTLGRQVRAARPDGALSLSALGILGSLNRRGPMVASQLALEERLKPQSLTRLLADLEESLLISRKRSELDRRAITITLTPKGRDALREDMSARREWLETAIAQMLEPAERDTILAASPLMIRLAGYEPSRAMHFEQEELL